MNRKAAIYSPTRFWIDAQLARMQIGIRKTVSMISMSAMPSMPSAQAKRPKIGAYSVNCHSGAPGAMSNFAQSSTPIAKSISVAASAIQRACCAETNRQAIAPSIGTARIAERMGKSSWFIVA